MATEATKIPFIEAAAPATPAAGQVVQYAKADGLMYSKNDAGVETLMSGGAGIGTSLVTAKGDIIAATASGAVDNVAVGANGTVLEAASGATAGVQWDYPPGYEFDYVQITAGVTPTATTEGTANTVVTANAVTFDGSAVIIEFFSASIRPDSTAAARTLTLWLYEDGSSIGNIGQFQTPAGSGDGKPAHVFRRMTPSAGSHTYSIRASVSAGTGSISAQAGGAGLVVPAFIRITKV